MRDRTAWVCGWIGVIIVIAPLDPHRRQYIRDTLLSTTQSCVPKSKRDVDYTETASEAYDINLLNTNQSGLAVKDINKLFYSYHM